jgi:hypothetical protein
MARKARKKSAAKTKKKRKPVAKKKSGAASRKKARKTKSKTKRKGVVATIVADFKAVVDTLSEAEQLHRKLEPRGSPESES